MTAAWVVFSKPRPTEEVLGAITAEDVAEATNIARHRFGRIFARVQSSASLEAAALLPSTRRSHSKKQPAIVLEGD